MQTIPLAKLHAHPDNANVMREADLSTLVRLMSESGDYPALIARPHPTIEGEFEMLDGHHRKLALERMGRAEARCEVWEVDDDRATLLLLTLNRLRGEDDPYRRAALVRQAAVRMELRELAARLPEDARKLKKLLAVNEAPSAPRPPRAPDDLPRAITFFLTAGQRRCLCRKLAEVSKDRSEAIVMLLGLDAGTRPPPACDT